MAWSGYSEKGQGGDERGPGTFTFNPIAAPQAQMQQASQVTQHNDRVQDLTLQTTGPEDRTFDVLLQGAGKLAEPYLNKVKGDLFFRGMQRAAQGEALNEIKNDRPWYAKIFGDGATVEGARVYSIEKAASEFTLDVESAMPELRKLGPQEVGAELQALGAKRKTGDDIADAAIGLSVMKTMPTLLKAQAKEHYKYIQEQNQLAQGNAWMATGQAYQSAKASGNYGSDDEDTWRLNTVNGMRQMPGQDDQSYQTNLANYMVLQAEAGNFHTLNLAREAGFMTVLPLQVRKAVESGINSYKRHAAAQAREDYAGVRYSLMARIRAGERVSGKEVNAAYKAANEQYAQHSGNDIPVFPQATRTSDALAGDQAIKAMDKAEAAAAAKAGNGEALLAAIGDSIRGGLGIAALKNSGQGLKESDIQTAAYAGYHTADDKVGYLAKATDGQTERIDGVADDFAVYSANSRGFDNNFMLGYSAWKQLGDSTNSNLQARYFSAKDNAKYGAFDRALGGRDLVKFGPAAYDVTADIRSDPNYKFTAKEESAVKNFIDSDVRGNNWMTFGLPKFDDASTAVITNAVAAQYGTIRQGSPNQQAALKDSLIMAKQQGLEYGGGFAWINPRGAKRLEQALNDTDSMGAFTERETYTALGETVKEHVKKAYGSAESVQLVRGLDIGGKAFFAVYARVDGAQQDPTFISADDLVANIKAARIKHQATGGWAAEPNMTLDAEPIPGVPGAFTTPMDKARRDAILGKYKAPAPGVQPSIYDTDPEHWRAYRAWQRANRK